MKHDPALAFFREEVAAIISEELKARGQFPLVGRRIADIGCGFGFWLARYLAWGARPQDLFGIDLDPNRAAKAVESCAGCNIEVADARGLPFRSGSFDVVSQFTLFSSIPEFENRARIAAEIVRIVRPGGVIVSYDFFAPNILNPRTRPLRKQELRKLFPNSSIVTRKVTLAPPLARAALRISTVLPHRLARFLVLRTHYIAFIEP